MIATQGLAGTALLALLVAAPAAAEPARGTSKDTGAADAPDRASYETVVTATRFAEVAFDSPRAIDVVSQRRLREQSASTTPEALDETPGVTMQRTNSAGGAPIVRGLIGQQVLLLIDGVRLNNALTRFGPNQLLNTVDPFQLARIEVLRGGGSMQHGSDALGGVINLVTRQPLLDPQRGWDARGAALLRFESASRAVVTHAEAEGQLGGVGLRLGGSWRRFGELEGGRDTGRQRFTAYGEGAVEAAAAWSLGRAGLLRASYAGVRQHDAPRTDRATPRDFQLFEDQLRDLVALRYEGYFATPLLAEAQASLSYQSHREHRARFRLDRDRIEREHDRVGSLGGVLALRSEAPRGSLHYGGELYYDRVASSAAYEGIASGTLTPQARGRYPDGAGYTQGGLYFFHRLPLGSRLQLDVGARAGAWAVDIARDAALGQPLEVSRLTAVGSGQARYRLFEGLNLVASLSQGYRAPNIDDYAAEGCSGQGFDTPNAELVPERSLTAEGGLKLDLYGRLLGNAFYAYTYLDDVIVRRTVEDAAPQGCGTAADGSPLLVAVTRRENAQRGRVHALEAQLQLAVIRGWWLESWVAWTRGSVDLPGAASEPMSRIPPLNGRVALRHQRGGARSFAELALRWAGAQRRLNGADRADLRICPNGAAGCRGTAGYAGVDLRGGYALTPELRLSLALENLSDQSYRVHGSGLDGPGFNAIATLEGSLP